MVINEIVNPNRVCELHRTVYLRIGEELTSIQKQPSRGVFSKRCSENMQQIYRRTPMPKCEITLFEVTLRHECSPVNLLHIFRTPFPKNTSGCLLLSVPWINELKSRLFMEKE